MDIERWEAKNRTRKFFRKILKYIRFSWIWVLVLVLMASLVGTAWALRINNLGMIEKRDQVLWADEFGTMDDLEVALSDLQGYVGRHMNTSMGSIGIVLQHTYNRKVQEVVREAAEAQEWDLPPEAYAQYDAECSPYLTAGEWQYVNCISSRMGFVGDNMEFVVPELPAAELYYVNFTPPHLSLDLAGILIIVDFLLLLVISLSLISNLVLRIAIRILYKTS